ncbi:hypothetical protein [Marinifilum flexuosum]|uniref:Uncharacterized protein n=1 Tax=Marinifilum flexuosum TaxID=1117708 RepID=A0A419X3W2_9BACT|nr:hypothetical protein [Marinifilum flexuosum]RKE02300.1 hypothetical protein BXY64_2388 [Marinifilum flexuosum]
MKKGEVLQLEQALQAVGNLRGVKFAYAVSKNMRTVKNECDDIRKSIEPSKEWQEVEKQQREINLEYCKKDNEGSPVPSAQGQFIILPEHKDAHKKKMDALKEEKKELFEIREKQIEDYNKSLDDEVEIKLHKINQDDIPEDITASQLEGIFDMVE